MNAVYGEGTDASLPPYLPLLGRKRRTMRKTKNIFLKARLSDLFTVVTCAHQACATKAVCLARRRPNPPVPLPCRQPDAHLPSILLLPKPARALAGAPLRRALAAVPVQVRAGLSPALDGAVAGEPFPSVTPHAPALAVVGHSAP